MKKRIIAIAVLLILVIVGLYLYINSSKMENQETACAADARQCSDGSYVSRNFSNNCEFSACPEAEKVITPPQHYAITIKDYVFSPSYLKIKVGDIVTWTNKDDDSHNIKSDPSGVINSTKLKWNNQYSYTFTQPGNYTYYCSIHAGMRGKIIVE